MKVKKKKKKGGGETCDKKNKKKIEVKTALKLVTFIFFQ